MALARRAVNQLDQALAEFNGKLTLDEKVQFRSISHVPDASSVIVLTAQLDDAAGHRKGRCIASRLSPLLMSIQQFSGVVGTFVSSNPAVAALVWGSVEFMLRLANNSFGFFDKLSRFLIGVGKICPRFREYQTLFSDVPELQTALCNYYAEVIRCCTFACEMIQRPDWLNYVRNAWTSFDVEFRPFQDRLADLAVDVKAEIKLAAAKAEQVHRIDMKHLVNQNRERRLRKLAQENVARRKALIDKISGYNYETAFHQARSKRHCGTSEWFVDEPIFRDWLSWRESSTFMLTGKLGCGKTVLLSYLITHLFSQRERESTTKIAYFFCRYNEEDSLQAATIARCIIRQYITIDMLDNQELENSLMELHRNEQVESLTLARILQLILGTSSMHYMVIDGIEECAEKDQRTLFSLLDAATRLSTVRVKLVLSRRGYLKSLRLLSLDKFGLYVQDHKVAADVGTYVTDLLEQQQKEEAFVTGDPDLFEEVRDALKAGAQGMFLWVALQMEEICSQTCDYDIRRAIDNLPASLQETYQRIQSRIRRNQKSELARQVFQWTAVARRPLWLYELQDALAVEKFASFSQPDRRINDIQRIIQWCEGLLILDEVSEEVAFAHPTVKSALVVPNPISGAEGLQFTIRDADKEAGEICATYLNFNDFRTKIIKRKAMQDMTAQQVLSASVSATGLSDTVTRRWFRVWQSRSLGHEKNLSIGQLFGDVRRATPQENDYPFMAYASEHWLSHSCTFQMGDIVWCPWYSLLEGNELARKPWTAEEWSDRDSKIYHYACEHAHFGLLSTLQFSGLPPDERSNLLRVAARSGNPECYRRVRGMAKVENDLLVSAASTGDLEMAEQLLGRSDRAMFRAMAEGGQLIIALKVASQKGHPEMVELLLESGIEADLLGNQDNEATAATTYGFHATMKQLLKDGGT